MKKGLTKGEENRLAQELMHKQIEWHINKTKFKASVLKDYGHFYEQLCSEWGRTNEPQFS